MRMIPDALALEYKRDYGCASGQVELSDFVNYPPLAREFCRLGLRLPEESLNLVLRNVSAVSNDASDPTLIVLDSVQHFT